MNPEKMHLRGLISGMLFLALLLTTLIVPPPRADEGMWTFDNVPVDQLNKRYGFTPSQAWLDHLRLSSVRIYASASFVSPDGLILTNHHVALSSAQRLSTPKHDYVHGGFYAKTRGEEKRVPGLTVQVLVSIADVTDRVKGAAGHGESASHAAERVKETIAAIEAEAFKASGLRAEVVSLYGGARYSLYEYKEYTDVRLVFIPELKAAFFGGDYDNFTYPRYDLDFAFFRAYEKGKPARVKNYLTVNPKGAPDGALVFVSGHPGRTDRLKTVAALNYYKALTLPASLKRLRHLQDLLGSYGKRGKEESRRAKTALYFIANSIKAREGEYRGLKDPGLMIKKVQREKVLRDAVAKNKTLKASVGDPWKDLESAYGWAVPHEKDRLYKTRIPGGGWGRLSSVALRMVRYAQESSKPDKDRLEGYHEADLPGLLRWLRSPSPYFKDMDRILLADDLKTIAKELGRDDPYVKTILHGKKPGDLATKIMTRTRLDDTGFRRGLLKKGGKAILSSQDPLLKFALRADPTLRATSKLFEDHVDAVERQALPRIARAQFAVMGKDAYPDATGTLRLAYGKVAGYPFATTLVPPHTTFYGLYDRAFSFGDKGDFRLTRRERERREKVDLSTPMDFVCTADITGGNSGSPIVDMEGRLVGLVFDGNQQSHPNTFVYDEKQARCVAVDIRAILEALDKLYDARPLRDEMLERSGKNRKAAS